MKSRSLAAAAVLIALLCVGLALFRSREKPAPQGASSQPSAEQVQPTPPAAVSAPEPSPILATPAPGPSTPPVVAQAEAATVKAVTNKLERLDRIRETFRALAAGDPKRALAAVREIIDEGERE